MDARRDAALFSLFREGSGPLSGLVRTLEVRRRVAARTCWGDGLSGEAQLFVQRFVRVCHSGLLDAGHLADLVQQPGEPVAPTRPVHAGRGDGLDGPATKQILVLGAPEELARLITDRL